MDKYYQLLDANSANVSPIWKVTHVTSMLFATISSFICAYTLGQAIEAFNENCILFANIVFLDNSTLARGHKQLPDYFHAIDMPATDWGTNTKCSFCQFTPVMSMISGLIWGAFFLICSKGGAGYISDEIYRPWRIVYPAIVFTLIAIGLLILSTVELSAGISIFCAQFKDIFNTTKCTNRIDEYTLLFYETEKPMIIFLKVSYISSIICIICWISLLITLILRIVCIVDFEMFKITVTFPSDSQEVLQTVVDPDNASDLEDNISVISKESVNKKPFRKHRFLKFLPLSLAKKISKLRRSSSDQYDSDGDDNISLTNSIFSGKIFVDNRSIKETMSTHSLDLISNTSDDVKVDIEKHNIEDQFIEELVFSSLFFSKRKKLVARIEDIVPKIISLPFLPHRTKSSNSLYSNQNQSNSNISTNEIEIVNSELNELQGSLLITSTKFNNTTENEKYISNNQINNENDDENIDTLSSKWKIDASSFFTDRESLGFVINKNDDENIHTLSSKLKIDASSFFTDRESLGFVINKNDDENIDTLSSKLKIDASSFFTDRKSLGFVQQSPPPTNNVLQFKQNSDDDLKIKIKVEEGEKFNNSTKNINLIGLSEQSNSVPIQLIGYEQNHPTDHVHLTPANEEFEVHKSFSNLTRRSSHQIMITPSNLKEQSKEDQITNEIIDSNNYIRHSSAILGLAKNNHQNGNPQIFPYTFRYNTEPRDEIPPSEFREEYRNEVNQTERNQIRETILRVYMALWLTIVLSNIGIL